MNEDISIKAKGIKRSLSLARKGARGKITTKLRITQKPQYFPAHLNYPSKNLQSLKWIYLFHEIRE